MFEIESQITEAISTIGRLVLTDEEESFSVIDDLFRLPIRARIQWPILQD